MYRHILILYLSLLGFASTSVCQIPADTPATFPGGEGAWRRYIERNMNDRADSTINLSSGLSTTITVSFIVEKNGSISHIEVVNKNNAHPKLAAEAIRILQQSPKWIPATKSGKPLRSYKKQSFVWCFFEE